MSICRAKSIPATNLILLTLAITCIAAPVIAKPDFSGIWVRDSKLSDKFTAVVAPVIGPGREIVENSLTMRIDHQARELNMRVEQDSKQPVAMSYDLGRGRHGNLNPEFGATTYRSEWKGDALVIEKSVFYRGNYGSSGGTVIQEWSLSQGGEILTVTTTTRQRKSAGGVNRKEIPQDLVTKEVFRRN